MPNPTRELKKRLKTQTGSFYDEAGLKAVGFPPDMAKAFLETVDKLDCVILSRTPGGAATQLITEGYDLKGYEIKSKSCNWGPMAGFLCKLPPLNKMGIENIKYNYKELQKYAKKWKKKDKPGTGTKYQYEDLFQHIKISDARKKEIFDPKSNYGIGKQGENYIVLKKTRLRKKPQMIYGICSTVNIEKENKVTMDYLLIKDGETQLWKTYHGDIFYGSNNKEYTGKEGTEFFSDKKRINKPINEDVTVHSEVDTFTINQKDYRDIKKLRNDFNSIKFSKWNFFPIQGAVNPFPPYPDSYKNCVTGDYDLFACWPKTTYPLQELIRQAEFSLGRENYFSDLGKSLTLGLRPAGTFNHIYIEFIPGEPAIEKLEDPKKGNINDLTELVAGTLNSIAGVALKNDKTYANKAFHSDEGGRPKINDIEFPVAYFMPVAAGFKFKEKFGGLIKNINEFLEFINTCAENGRRVTLSHGWFIFLITHALNNDERKKIKLPPKSSVKEKVSKYFDKFSYQEECRDKVLKYLLGYYALGMDEKSKKHKKKRYKATPKFLNKVAKVFLPFLDMEEADKSEIIGKVQAAKNIAYDHDPKEDFEVY